MAYDEAIADRIRRVVGPRPDVNDGRSIRFPLRALVEQRRARITLGVAKAASWPWGLDATTHLAVLWRREMARS